MTGRWGRHARRRDERSTGFSPYGGGLPWMTERGPRAGRKLERDGRRRRPPREPAGAHEQRLERLPPQVLRRRRLCQVEDCRHEVQVLRDVGYAASSALRRCQFDETTPRMKVYRKGRANYLFN